MQAQTKPPRAIDLDSLYRQYRIDLAIDWLKFNVSVEYAEDFQRTLHDANKRFTALEFKACQIINGDEGKESTIVVRYPIQRLTDRHYELLRETFPDHESHPDREELPDNLRAFEVEILDEYTEIEKQIREAGNYLQRVSAVVRAKMQKADVGDIQRQIAEGFQAAQAGLAGIAAQGDDEAEATKSSRKPATVSREVKRARQFFRAAMRKRLIAENPFTDLSTPAQVNRTREHFVTTAIIEKVIEACPDGEWRLIVALSRYGGLRCPSEHLSLKWGDVDWEHNRVTIRSPKTEHHAGGESRVIPLFPELRPHLETLFFDEERAGTEHIITRYRDKNANLRTQLLRIIKRAGVKPWPKLFHNLRASRQTELTARFPLHVVCEWIGNSAPIADKHYLQVTDDHFDDAVTTTTPEVRGTESGTVDAEIGTEAAQFPAQQSAAQSRTDSQETKEARGNRAVLLPTALACDSMLDNQVPPRGVEPSAQNSVNTEILGPSDVDSDVIKALLHLLK